MSPATMREKTTSAARTRLIAPVKLYHGKHSSILPAKCYVQAWYMVRTTGITEESNRGLVGMGVVNLSFS